MAEELRGHHTGGIAITAFVVALAASMAYYQFMYVPQANAKPVISKAVLEPEQTTRITIVEGSTSENNGRFFNPKEIRATLGLSNRVIWTNNDAFSHTVTSDNGYKDAYSGVFDSRECPQEQGGPFVEPGKEFEFLFTDDGNFAYHCEPHPWMKGIVKVVENFA